MLRYVPAGYLAILGFGMFAGASQPPLPADEYKQPPINILSRAASIAAWNTGSLVALAIGNVCSFGIYGAVSMGTNGYLGGRVAATVARHDPHVFKGFLAYALCEFLSLYLVAVASMASGSALVFRPSHWVRTIRRAAVTGAVALGLIVAAALLEAGVVSCLSGRMVAVLCDS